MRARAWIACLALGLPLPLSSSEGAAFLKSPQGAASTALAGAMVGGRGADALWYTPAAVARQQHWQLSLSHASWLGGSQDNTVAAALPLGAAGGLGLWAYSAGAQDVYRDASGNDGGSFGVDDRAAGVAGALGWGPLGLGLGVKALQQRVEQWEQSAWAADLGAQLELGTPRARLGLAAQNLGPRISDDRMLGEVKLPLTYRAGLALDGMFGFLTLLQELRLCPESGETSYLAGLQLQQKTGALTWVLRTGYDSSAQDAGAHGKLSALTLGGGIQWGGLRFDAALQPYGALGGPFSLSLGWDLTPAERVAPAPEPPSQRQDPAVNKPAPPVQAQNAGVLVDLPEGAVMEGQAQTFASAADAIVAGHRLIRADPVGARDAYAAATRLDPRSAEAWAGLGQAEQAQGHKAAAVEAFQQMLGLRPDAGFSRWLQGYRQAP